MPEQKKLKVILLRHTLSPEETVALAAKLCYSRSTISDLQDRISSRDQSDFIGKLISMGHESVLEHVSFTFGVEGVSRVLLAQLTRHRIASFSVQSQRYVSYETGFGYIIPESITALGEDAVRRFTNRCRLLKDGIQTGRSCSEKAKNPTRMQGLFFPTPVKQGLSLP